MIFSLHLSIYGQRCEEEEEKRRVQSLALLHRARLTSTTAHGLYTSKFDMTKKKVEEEAERQSEGEGEKRSSSLHYRRARQNTRPTAKKREKKRKNRMQTETKCRQLSSPLSLRASSVFTFCSCVPFFFFFFSSVKPCQEGSCDTHGGKAITDHYALLCLACERFFG